MKIAIEDLNAAPYIFSEEMSATIDSRNTLVFNPSFGTRWDVVARIVAEKRCVVRVVAKHHDRFVFTEARTLLPHADGKIACGIRFSFTGHWPVSGPPAHPKFLTFELSLLGVDLVGAEIVLPDLPDFGEAAGRSVVVIEDRLTDEVRVTWGDSAHGGGWIPRRIVEELIVSKA